MVFTSTNKRVLLENVLYILELGVNLLSLSLITSRNYSLSFNKQNCYIYTPKNTLLTKGSYKEGVSVFSAISSKLSNYKASNKPITTLNTSNLEELDNSLESDLDLVDPNIEDNSSLDLNLNKDLTTSLDLNNNIDLDNNIDLNNEIDLESNLESNLEEDSSNSKRDKIVFNKNTIELAHKRLGHINLKAIKELKDNTKGVNIDLKDIDTASTSLDNCIICIQAKLTKNRSTKSNTKVSAYLDLIYIDIGGPIRPKTFRGFKYYITFRDSYTKYLVVKLLKSRKNIVTIIKNTIIELELEAKDNSSNNSSNSNILNSTTTSSFNNNKVKALQLDNEFKSKELDNYLATKGIVTRYSAPYTPEQNGAAEIINRVLLNKVRALLLSSNLPKNL
jgi:hypothetical protein